MASIIDHYIHRRRGSAGRGGRGWMLPGGKFGGSRCDSSVMRLRDEVSDEVA
jgi:hypothetical protein